MRLVPLLLACACVPTLKPPLLADNPTHDFDGDGANETEGDCDDEDDRIEPGIDEVCGDGVDNNCDGSPEACAPTGELDLGSLAVQIAVGEDFGDGGWSVGGLPDLNDNGADELLVGVPGFHSGNTTDVGALLIVEGPVDAEVYRSAANWQPGFGEYARFGTVVGAAGDFDGDGNVDAFCSAPAFRGGMIGIFTNVLRDATWQYAESLTDGDELGASAAAAGDLDGDGLDDLFVGAPGVDNQAGALILVYGSTSTFVAMDELPGPTSGGRAGTSLAAPGDLDGDGVGEVAVGAPSAGEGQVWVLLGPIDDNAGLEDQGLRLDGVSSEDQAGAAISGAGDADGDGLLDLAIGAPLAGVGAGTVYIVRSPPTEGDLSDTWATIEGAPLEHVGTSIAAPSDLDGDGATDLAIGAPGWGDGLTDVGAVYVFGALAEGTYDADTASLILRGESEGGEAGFSVASAGDLNGDSRADLAIGAPFAEIRGAVAGETYVLLAGEGY